MCQEELYITSLNFRSTRVTKNNHEENGYVQITKCLKTPMTKTLITPIYIPHIFLNFFVCFN